MAAFGGPPGVRGTSFFDPVACPGVQRAISAHWIASSALKLAADAATPRVLEV